MDALNAKQITAALRDIEDIVMALDEAIEASHVDAKTFSSLRQKFEKSKNSLLDHSDVHDSRLFIIDEAQALLHWIEGDKASALTFIKSSVKIKGDRLLLSESARGLANPGASQEAIK